MAAALRSLAVALVLFCLAIGPAFAQNTQATDTTQATEAAQPSQGTEAAQPAQPAQIPAPADAFKFSMRLGLGVQTFDEPDTYNGTPTTTYSSISLAPDFSYGKWGLGIDITLNYRITGSSNTFQVRQADWVPTSVQNFFQIYLAKIVYVRYGLKGDPLFAKLGSFDDGTLGDGFIMVDYSNRLFLPGTGTSGCRPASMEVSSPFRTSGWRPSWAISPFST